MSKPNRKKSNSFRSQERNPSSSSHHQSKNDGAANYAEFKRRDKKSGKYNTISGKHGRRGLDRGLDSDSNDFLISHNTYQTRSISRYAGLPNGGSTCYMNSVLQQLFHTPGVSQDIRMATRSSNPRSIFYQMQQAFRSLDDGRQPQMTSFWRAYKLWGEPINTFEQQDAYEFFVDLISQLDEHLKDTNQAEVFKPKFQGMYSDAKYCHDCKHSYESQEQFLAISLTVKPEKSLEAGLQQFVEGVKLDGDNKYLCEDCGVKRDATKTMCIKTLPPVLVIHLKRIRMDWQTGRATKFNDYFQFPQHLDMKPYTLKSIQKKTSGKSKETKTKQKGVKRDASALSSESDGTLYRLVGVVVHTGQANAGHYYSLIMDRQRSVATNPSGKETWYKCNDTSVREYQMTDTALEDECFGGSASGKRNKNNWYDYLPGFSSSGHEKCNSGYMLFYEKVDASSLASNLHHQEYEQETTPKKMHASSSVQQDQHASCHEERKPSTPQAEPEVNQGVDHTSDRTGSADQTDKKKTSSSSKEKGSMLVSRTTASLASSSKAVPGEVVQVTENDKGSSSAESTDASVDLHPAIQEALRFENIQIKRVRYSLFSHSFNFLSALREHGVVPKCSKTFEWSETYTEQAKLSLEYAIKLLPHNCSNNKTRIGPDKMDEWPTYIQILLKYSKEASMWAIQFLGNHENYKYILYYLVEHDNVEIRKYYSRIVLGILQSFIDHTSSMRSSHLGKAMEEILSLLDTKIPSHSQTCTEYFIMLKEYLLGSVESFTYVQHMLEKGAFERFIIFLIGPVDPTQTVKRRWTALDAEHFAPLIHTMLAKMITNCDISSLRPSEYRNTPYSSRKRPPITMSDDMHKIFDGLQFSTYIKEALLAVCEYPAIRSDVIDILKHCCYCNNDISVTVLNKIFELLQTCPQKDMEPLQLILMEILLIYDPLKATRLDMAIKDLNRLMCMFKNTDSKRFTSLLAFVSSLIAKNPQLNHVTDEWEKVARSKSISDKKLSEAMSMLTISGSQYKTAGHQQGASTYHRSSSRHSASTGHSATYQHTTTSSVGTFYNGYN